MDTIEIVDYGSIYKDFFRDLNVEWISTYFKMELSDYKALENADSYILQNGGHILVALLNKQPVGVCALIKMDDPIYDFELAKMAVSPKAQGKKIGWLIGVAIKDKARSVGAKTLYLESNTILIPAINLYRKLGFIEVFGRISPYERCNIQMALTL
jgi:GNAT superfamily N-acetyltransferase